MSTEIPKVLQNLRIPTPTPEITIAVQEALFTQGFDWTTKLRTAITSGPDKTGRPVNFVNTERSDSGITQTILHWDCNDHQGHGRTVITAEELLARVAKLNGHPQPLRCTGAVEQLSKLLSP